MLSPSNYRVNEAWIVVKINDAPFYVKNDAYDVCVLMDAGSTYVFGHALSRVADGSVSDDDVKAIFDTAWRSKRQWPEKVIVTDNSKVSAIFEKQAKENGLPVIFIPVADLELIVGELINLSMLVLMAGDHISSPFTNGTTYTFTRDEGRNKTDARDSLSRA